MKSEHTIKINTELTTTVKLNEREVRALNALVGYGIESFLDVFYNKLGKFYMSPYEQGLRDLFVCVNNKISPSIIEFDKIKKAIKELEK